MKRNNTKKYTSMLLAFVLLTMLFVMPAQQAHAALSSPQISGFSLNATSSTSELISAEVITVSGTITSLNPRYGRDYDWYRALGITVENCLNIVD